MVEISPKDIESMLGNLTHGTGASMIIEIGPAELSSGGGISLISGKGSLVPKRVHR
jgi:hypothetical protein